MHLFLRFFIRTLVVLSLFWNAENYIIDLWLIRVHFRKINELREASFNVSAWNEIRFGKLEFIGSAQVLGF